MQQARIFVFRWQGEPWNKEVADNAVTFDYEKYNDLFSHCFKIVQGHDVTQCNAFAVGGDKLLCSFFKSVKKSAFPHPFSKIPER